jgi:hypothetical protein
MLQDNITVVYKKDDALSAWIFWHALKEDIRIKINYFTKYGLQKNQKLFEANLPIFITDNNYQLFTQNRIVYLINKKNKNINALQVIILNDPVTIWKYLFSDQQQPIIIDYFKTSRAVVKYFKVDDFPLYTWEDIISKNDYTDIIKQGTGILKQEEYECNFLCKNAQDCKIGKYKAKIVNSSILQYEIGKKLAIDNTIGIVWWYNIATDKTHMLVFSNIVDLTSNIINIIPIKSSPTMSKYIIDGENLQFVQK